MIEPTQKIGLALRQETPFWIDWAVVGTVRGALVHEVVRTHFRAAEAAYDDDHHMKIAQGHALATAKRRAGLHPCTSSRLLCAAPRDWSRTLDAAFAYPADAPH